MARSSIGGIFALVISIIAGAEIALFGFMLAAGGGLFSISNGIGGIFGIMGMVWGILIIVSASMMFIKKERHVLWGALVIVFSVASLFGDLGGFFLGLILGIIGGILGIVLSPVKKRKEITESTELPAR